MAVRTSGLTVRQHERATLGLRAEFEVADHHRDQVRFNPATSGTGAFVVMATALDVSPGGIGLRSPLFVPRNCEGVVRVLAPGTGNDIIFEHDVKVRRARLDGSDEGYFLGTAFLKASPDIGERVAALTAYAPATKVGGDA